MKKKIAALIALSMMIMGVVTAASINGDYKGKPIVNVVSNGKHLIVEDAPAVIMDGRTMVPISMLKQLGIGVTWDAKTYSAEVTLPSEDTDHLVHMANYYKSFEDHAEQVKEISYKLFIYSEELLYDENSLKHDPDAYITHTIKEYNAAISNAQEWVDYLEPKETTINDVIALVNKSLDLYRQAQTELLIYAETVKLSKTPEYQSQQAETKQVANEAFNNYTSFYEQADVEIAKAIALIQEKYNEFISLFLQ